MNGEANENNADNFGIDNSNARTNKSFDCKTKIIGSSPDDNNTLDTGALVP